MPTSLSDQRPGDRIAKLLARAGIASRREIERMIEDGRVALNGVAITTPATVLTSLAGITVDGNPVEAPAPARLFLYHKPTGLLVTERDPRGRETIYDRLPAELPRVVPVGRLDLNTEGLLLLTTDGGFKRQLELPATGVERSYRARTYGNVTQAQLEALADGIEIEGIRYGSIDANIERRTGANVWIEVTLTEGKNREVRRVLEHLGLQVSRLIRTRYGPFVLGDMPPGDVGEVRAQDIHAFRRTLKGGAPDEPVVAAPRDGFRTVAMTDRTARSGARPARSSAQPARSSAAAAPQRNTSAPRVEPSRPAFRARAATQRPSATDRPARDPARDPARETSPRAAGGRSGFRATTPREERTAGAAPERGAGGRSDRTGAPPRGERPAAGRTDRAAAPRSERPGFRTAATTDRTARTRGRSGAGARDDGDARPATPRATSPRTGRTDRPDDSGAARPSGGKRPSRPARPPRTRR